MTLYGVILISWLALFWIIIVLMFALVLFDVAKGGENLRELGLEINYQLEIYH